MAPRGQDKAVVSQKTMRDAVLKLLAALEFKHNLKPTRQECRRIDTVLDTLAKEGKLTTGFWKKRQHAGIVVVRLMGQAWFTNCLTHGCRSWDVAISRFLAISLMTCTAGRAGDIVRTRLYKGAECLRWEHIQLILLDGGRDNGQPPAIQDLTARITLEYEKGHKCVVFPPSPVVSPLLTYSRNHRNVDKVVIVKALDDVQGNNTICPIKLLLIHALRTGHVAYTSVESLLRSVQSTPSRTIQWTHQSDPVIAAIKSTCFLDFTHPAAPEQVSKTVKQAALLAGVLVPLSSHDVRAGVARDVASLPAGSIRGVAGTAVAKVLGHSHQTLRRGATDRYAGGISTAFNVVVAKQAQADPFIMPKVAEQGFSRRRYIPRAETTRFCQENGLDDSNEADRMKARQRIAEADQVQWAQKQKDILQTPKLQIPPALPPAPTPRAPGLSQKRKALTAPVATSAPKNSPLPLAQRSPNLPPPAKRQRGKTGSNELGRTTAASAAPTAAELDAVQAVPSQPAPATGEQLPPMPDALIDPRLLNEGISDVLDEDGVCDATLNSVPVDPGHASTLSSLILGHDNGNSSGSTTEGDEEAVHDGDNSPAHQQLLDDRIEDCIIDQAVEDVIHDKKDRGGGDDVNLTLANKSPAAAIGLPDARFVDYFARINVVRNQGLVEDMLKHGESALERHVGVGHSRDKPTLYRIRCPNASLGCDYSNERSRNVNRHAVTCSKKLRHQPLPEVAEKKDDGAGHDDDAAHDDNAGHDDRPFACSRDGCAKRFATKKGLREHISRWHDWIPKKCVLPECPRPTTIWATRTQHAVHLRDDHDTDWTPSKCNVPGCKSTHIFETRTSFRTHLQVVHELRADELLPYLPSKRRPATWPRGCPVAGCKHSTSKFTQAAALRKHLKGGAHKFGDDQIESLLEEVS